ncbi:MAG: alanine--tRNA ligase, partial [Pelagibacteraceae bacterium]
GETGPCGPCSEIFYDHGDHLFGGPPGSKDQDGDRFIEIWNLVFMQYEQISKDKRINLPKPSVDTGMGLERMAAVLQGTHDNYGIDLFKNLISLSSEITKTKVSKDNISSHRVISDHLRATCFLIADGLMPSNEGRGYVLRRIMRRALRHIHTLGSKDRVLSKMAPHLINEMSSEYVELINAKEFIIETILNEEEKFNLMLSNGMKILDDEIKNVKSNIFSGDIAFKLYDTYGFPLDLTQDFLKSKKIEVDIKKFDELMFLRKESAKKSWKGSGSSTIDKLWFDLHQELGNTEFVGYSNTNTEGKILSIVKDNKTIGELKKSEEGIIITNQTCFYAEAGGQIGDTGNIKFSNSNFSVEDTQKLFGSFYMHIGKVKEGIFKINDNVILEVDRVRRSLISGNHSATHLLHASLRENLGKHVTQKGSYVGPDRLRFDFSHSKSLSDQELDKINEQVNLFISQNDNVVTKLMSPKKAVEQGAMALFGEKYGEEVRVVSMGKKIGKSFSIELCGGIHVKKTGEIGRFSIVSESSISSGVRRVEALCGDSLKKFEAEEKDKSKQVKQNYENKLQDILKKIKSLNGNIDLINNLSEDKKLIEAEKYLEKLNIENILSDKNKNIQKTIKKGEITIQLQKLLNFPSKEIRSLVDKAKIKKNDQIIFVFSLIEEKISIAVGVSDNLTTKYDASIFAKELSSLLGGVGGGGRKDFAQSGGLSSKNIDEAVKKIIDKI